MRIASMLPSATEIAYLLGLGDQVIGVSHECDYPPEARDKPRVTRPPFDAKSLASNEIDRLVSESISSNRELYHVDGGQMALLKPDLILTQGLCDVCAISVRAVRSALRDSPKVLSLQATSLEGMLEDIEQVAEATGIPRVGQATAAKLRDRMEAIRRRSSELPRKSVACLEWLDPPYNAGHWVPEMVDIAGGKDVLSRAGEFSRRIRWTELIDAKPEVIVLMPCGFGTQRSADELELLSQQPGWRQLPAVRSHEVWAVDANSYFSRPGPRLVDGLELMAGILHPEAFGKPDSQAAVRAI